MLSWAAGNRAIVQVFEGTSGIDVKKVRWEDGGVIEGEAC